MHLSLSGRLEEPHLGNGNQESSKSHPEKDVDLIVDFVDEQAVVETSGLSADSVFENFFKSKIGARRAGHDWAHKRKSSCTVYHRVVATNQRGEIADEECISCQWGGVKSGTRDSALSNNCPGGIVIDKGVGYVTKDVHGDGERYSMKNGTNRTQQHQTPV